MSIKERDARSRADSGRLASTSASRRDAALTGGLPSGARGDGSYAARPEAAAPSGSSRGAGHGGPPLQRGTSRGSSSADPGVLPALHPEWTAATTVRTRRGGDARAPGAVTGALRPAGLPLVPALPPGEQAVRERALVPRSGHNDGSEVVVQEDPALADALAYSINMETAEELERQCAPPAPCGRRPSSLFLCFRQEHGQRHPNSSRTSQTEPASRHNTPIYASSAPQEESGDRARTSPVADVPQHVRGDAGEPTRAIGARAALPSAQAAAEAF